MDRVAPWPLAVKGTATLMTTMSTSSGWMLTTASGQERGGNIAGRLGEKVGAGGRGGEGVIEIRADHINDILIVYINCIYQSYISIVYINRIYQSYISIVYINRIYHSYILIVYIIRIYHSYILIVYIIRICYSYIFIVYINRIYHLYIYVYI